MNGMRQPPARRSLDDLYRESMGLAEEEPPMPQVTSRPQDTAQKSLDELYAQTMEQAREPERDAKGPSLERGTTIGEDIVGMTRQAANKALFGQYPRLVGALGGDEEALRGYMTEYEQRAGGKAKMAQIAGEVAPYFAGGAGLVRAGLGRAGLGNVMRGAEQAYGALRTAPGVGAVARKLLPASAGTAAEIAAIEGARGAVEAAPGERMAGGVQRAAMALPFGRFGEVVGTALAARTGPTLGKQAATIQKRAEDIGEQIGRWKEGADVPLTPTMARLYQRSEALRTAVDEAANRLGLPGTNARVIANAYSDVVRQYRGTPQMADLQKVVLQPFLREIDNAAQGPLSPLIRKYADAKKAEEAVTTGRQAVQYMRTGQGSPSRVSPEVLTQRASRPYVSTEEAQSLAQALIAAQAGKGTLPSGNILQQLGQYGTALGRAGTIADLVQQLGGTPSFSQRMTQQAGRAIGATQTPIFGTERRRR